MKKSTYAHIESSKHVLDLMQNMVGEKAFSWLVDAKIMFNDVESSINDNDLKPLLNDEMVSKLSDNTSVEYRALLLERFCYHLNFLINTKDKDLKSCFKNKAQLLVDQIGEVNLTC